MPVVSGLAAFLHCRSKRGDRQAKLSLDFDKKMKDQEVILNLGCCIRGQSYFFMIARLVSALELSLMRKEETDVFINAVNEWRESCDDTIGALRTTMIVAKNAKRLWRNEKRSWLIKAGLALIAFPDPTISDVAGTFLVAAGLVQEGIKRRTLHVDDIYKTLGQTLKEVRSAQDSL